MRKSWDEYFIDLTEVVATRSTCPKLSVGAVLVKDNRILATGYNGSLNGEPHCTDVGCLEIEGRCKRTVHAEDNVLRQVEPYRLIGASLYVNHGPPCRKCAHQILYSGIAELVYLHEYVKDKEYVMTLLEEQGIVIRGIGQ